jgi:predicted transcriptional regulator
MTIRPTVEIFVQILETVHDHDGNEADDHDGGITETGIMYDVIYLSGAQLREYLIALTVHVLLIYDPIMRTYDITGRGIRFLELYSKLDDMMEEEREKEEIEM